MTATGEQPPACAPEGATPGWSVYLLRCSDGTLYAGSTNNVDARVRAHNDGRGARYTSGRRPVSVVYAEACGTMSDALRREHALKRLTRAQKDALIGGHPSSVHGRAPAAAATTRSQRATVSAAEPEPGATGSGVPHHAPMPVRIR
jgi:putative endonuclease